MGYYASGNGTINFKEEPSEELLKNFGWVIDYYKYDNKSISVGFNDKYNEDAIEAALNELAPYTKSGEMEFVGEDGAIWRFIFDKDEWKEESGTRMYDSEIPDFRGDRKDDFIGYIIDIIQDTMDNPRGEIIEGEWYDRVAAELEDLMYNWKVFR
jgi:hypothetical protein